ncbi:MAG: hypothetical protein K0R28_271 [Paenibacillus sp.]|jgi:hypothetical protein|nr:hypothetical protein [Paenibacillus sp.]
MGRDIGIIEECLNTSIYKGQSKEYKMEKDGNKTVIHSEGRNEMNGDEAPIILDGQATAEAPVEPSLIERTKEVMENIGIEINSI